MFSAQYGFINMILLCNRLYGDHGCYEVNHYLVTSRPVKHLSGYKDHIWHDIYKLYNWVNMVNIIM